MAKQYLVSEPAGGGGEVTAEDAAAAFAAVFGVDPGQVSSSTDLGYEPEMDVPVAERLVAADYVNITFARLTKASDPLVVEVELADMAPPSMPGNRRRRP